MSKGVVISKHFLRRTARKKVLRLRAAQGNLPPVPRFRVEPYVHGPFGWKVVRYPA